MAIKNSLINHSGNCSCLKFSDLATPATHCETTQLKIVNKLSFSFLSKSCMFRGKVSLVCLVPGLADSNSNLGQIFDTIET